MPVPSNLVVKGFAFALAGTASLAAPLVLADSVDFLEPPQSAPEVTRDAGPEMAEEHAAPDTRPLARLGARLAYNDALGTVVGATVASDRLFDDRARLRFGIEASEDSLAYDLDLSMDAAGGSPVFGLGISADRSEANDLFAFDSESVRLTPRLTWDLGAGHSVASYLSFSRAEISDVSATTSALIRADEVSRTRTALGLRYSWLDRSPGQTRLGQRHDLVLELGQTSEDHEFLLVQAKSAASWSFGADTLRLTTRVSAGTIHALGGESHVGDRFVLGQASLRGFAFGGYGPRDMAVADEPALGGNSFAVARIDAQFPRAFGDAPVLPGVFVDVGTLWGLDNTAGGLAGADPVDDSAHLRASAGVSMEFDTGVGKLQLNAAVPLQKEDYDRVENFSLSFQTAF
ncbi:BamA/TamA family outer membrane protein [Oceanicola sp. S124]|uniref:BamA/TamA family outer membrane protein n=1 Tax=Oceanicola sp. S124 TaxID=1042378 RepID=UPI000255898B|nr:BamA/TamA family outer membrane protein [Oceanicola sp. S124]